MKISNFKTIKISPDLHKQLKCFCDKEGLKLNNWIEKQLQIKIDQINNEKA